MIDIGERSISGRGRLVRIYCMYVHRYGIYSIYVQIKSSFPKRDKRHSKHWACNGNAKFIDCVLEKSFSYTHIYIFANSIFWLYINIVYISVYICAHIYVNIRHI